MLLFMIVTLLCLGTSTAEECDARSYGESSFVCVCTESSCGFSGLPVLPTPGSYSIYSSSLDGLRLEQSNGDIQVDPEITEYNATININGSFIMQEMIGFGGSFTDAFGEQLFAVTPELAEVILSSYFSSEGSNYDTCRTPIAGSDFSSRPYSYDDGEPDPELINFALQPEDYNYKLPYMRRAKELNPDLKFFGSPWSSPSWMKTNNMINGSGRLLEEMQQPWANYFVKFLEAYESEGVQMWGLTAQNEPVAGGGIPGVEHAWNQLAFNATEQANFVRDYLGPTLNISGYGDVKLMIFDDNRQSLPNYPITVYSDPGANQYVHGMAQHWYFDSGLPPGLVEEVHDAFPDKFILNSEACTGPALTPVVLGSWERGEDYVVNIIENMNVWSAGWVDWNMGLDLSGGPNWATNEVDSPIIVNATANEFYKQPMYYALGHFSKFIKEGDTKLGISVDTDLRLGAAVKSTVVQNSEGLNVLILLNTNDEDQNVLVNKPPSTSFSLSLPARSFHTVMFNDL